MSFTQFEFNNWKPLFYDLDIKECFGINNWTHHNQTELKNSRGNKEFNFNLNLETGLGIFVTFFICERLFNFAENFSSIKNHKYFIQNFLKKALIFIFTLFYYAVFLVVLPILIFVTLIFEIYRNVVKTILSRKYSDLVSLLDGPDAVWSIEDNESKSIIMGLGFVEVKNGTEPKEIINYLRKEIKEKLFKNLNLYGKLVYERHREFGYYFWKKPANFQITDHIRELDLSKISDSTISEYELCKLVSQYSNEDLPNNHLSTWEILVGQQYLEDLKTIETSKKIPVVFRMHHSIGDGVALLKLLLGILAESDFYQKLTIDDTVEEKPSAENKQSNYILFYLNIILIKIIKIFYFIKILIFVPQCLVSQLFLQGCKNPFNGHKLSGIKYNTWRTEDKDLLKTLQNVKRLMPGVRISDILLSCLSSGMKRYFDKLNQNIPSSITVVLPARMDVIRNSMKFKKSAFGQDGSKRNHFMKIPNFNSGNLTNEFTVGVVDIPIYQDTNMKNGIRNTHCILNKLGMSSDYWVNYWLLKLSGVFPVPIIKPVLLNLSKCTIVVSNIPGPSTIRICGGFILNNLMFWLPNRGQTGLGLSIFTYGDRINFGLISDKNVIPNIDETKLLLDLIVESVKNVDSVLKIN